MALGIIFFILGLLGTLAIAARVRAIGGPLVAGYLSRVAFVLVDHFALGLSLGGRGDSYHWDRAARVWAEQGLGEILSHADTGHHMYKVYMGLMYYTFGHSALMLQVINAFLGTLVILIVWRLAYLVSGDSKASRRAAWLIALFPSAILHSGMLLREAVVTLPLTYGVYQLALWQRTHSVTAAVLSGVALLTSMAFHSGAFVVILAAFVWIAGTWIRSLLAGQLGRVFRITSALVVAGVVVIGISGSRWGMSKFNKVDSADASSLAGGSRGRAGYLGDLRSETPADLVLHAPIRVVFFLFSPFPWMVRTLPDLVGVIDSLLFLWLVTRLFRSRSILLTNPSAMLVATACAVFAVTFAMGVTNYGTAFRHRSKMTPILVSVAAVLSRRKYFSKSAVARPNPPHVMSPGTDSARFRATRNRDVLGTPGASEARELGASARQPSPAPGQQDQASGDGH